MPGQLGLPRADPDDAWDTQGQLIAVEGARLLDLLPLFSEPISRSFMRRRTRRVHNHPPGWAAASPERRTLTSRWLASRDFDPVGRRG